MLNEHYIEKLIRFKDAHITKVDSNNKIKVLKRNACGIRNFNRFRNRILHMMNRVGGN